MIIILLLLYSETKLLTLFLSTIIRHTHATHMPFTLHYREAVG